MENAVPLPTEVRENFLTKPPTRDGVWPTLILVALLTSATGLYLSGKFGADQWMFASPETVFGHHEYWRAWTALFAHGDGTHLLSNLFLFIPFAYFLSAYFHPLFFPLAGFAIGGALNFFVLAEMPAKVGLVGVSGVVYWMGAAWITLSLLIDHRGPFSRRLLKALGVSLVLFMPEQYQAQTSYLAHLLGYAGGVISALAYYLLKRAVFRAAEERQLRVEFIPDWMNDQDGIEISRIPRPPLRACTLAQDCG